MEFTVRTDWEMGFASTTKSRSVKLGIASVGFSQGLPHGGTGSALLMDVGVADGSDEAFTSFVFGQDNVVLL
ncbi:hypothetical protein ABTH46_19960, partial [Acinetobacter baumannii]